MKDVEQILAKEEVSIVGHINRYSKQLLHFIRSKVSSDEDAEDILQDVWYQFLNISELDSIESMSGWLFRVAKNKITDRFRKKKSVSLEDFSFESEDGEINFKEILLSTNRTAEDDFFRQLVWDTLQEALDELPEKQREVFILNELEDKTLQEIADLKQENLKTIISRKGYAIKHLRQRLNMLYKDFLTY